MNIFLPNPKFLSSLRKFRKMFLKLFFRQKSPPLKIKKNLEVNREITMKKIWKKISKIFLSKEKNLGVETINKHHILWPKGPLGYWLNRWPVGLNHMPKLFILLSPHICFDARPSSLYIYSFIIKHTGLTYLVGTLYYICKGSGFESWSFHLFTLKVKFLVTRLFDKNKKPKVKNEQECAWQKYTKEIIYIFY
jgi:hypothetical protein